jgi:ferredoxin
MATTAARKKPGFFERLFGPAPQPHLAPSPEARVTPDSSRCVQCGVCGYNCPVGIPVRDYACRGRIVDLAECVQCGQCIEACPRGTLRWAVPGRAHLETSPELDALLGEYFGGRPGPGGGAP